MREFGGCWSRPKQRKRRSYKSDRSSSDDAMNGATKTRWTFQALWIGLAVIVLVAAFGVGIVRREAIRSQREDLVRQASRGLPVLVMQLTRRPQTREILLPGEIHGYYETPIYAKIDGYIKTLLVDKGSRVRAGQLVATIE